MRFILKARKGDSGRSGTAEESLSTFEEGIASLALSTYQRGSISTHTATDGSEVRRLKGYVEVVLMELLEVGA